MAKLSSAARKKIPGKEFGLPGKRAYPMPDRSHAENALARASEMYARGKLSADELKEIREKAHKKLGKGRG
jgi:hypothetical protein